MGKGQKNNAFLQKSLTYFEKFSDQGNKIKIVKEISFYYWLIWENVTFIIFVIEFSLLNCWNYLCAHVIFLEFLKGGRALIENTICLGLINKILTGVGSGESRSSSEGLGGDALELDVLVRDALEGASESLHCSTSTSTSSSTSGNRSTEIGPAINNGINNQKHSI